MRPAWEPVPPNPELFRPMHPARLAEGDHVQLERGGPIYWLAARRIEYVLVLVPVDVAPDSSAGPVEHRVDIDGTVMARPARPLVRP